MKCSWPSLERMSNEDQIRDLLKTFERALETSHVALAAGCYMKDAVAMGAGFPTLAGSEMPGVYVQVHTLTPISTISAPVHDDRQTSHCGSDRWKGTSNARDRSSDDTTEPAKRLLVPFRIF